MPPKTAQAPASKRPLEDGPSTIQQPPKRNPQMTAGKEGVVKPPPIPTRPVAASSSLKGANVNKGPSISAAQHDMLKSELTKANEANDVLRKEMFSSTIEGANKEKMSQAQVAELKKEHALQIEMLEHEYQQHLQAEVKVHAGELNIVKDKLHEAQQDLTAANEQISKSKAEKMMMEDEMEDLKQKSHAEVANLTQKLSDAIQEKVAVDAECAALTSRLAMTTAALKAEEDRTATLRQSGVEASSNVAFLTAEKASVEARLASKTVECDQLRDQVATANARLLASQGNIFQLSASDKEKDELLVMGERERRKLLNIIEDMRGNIRVYCRVRPTAAGSPSAQLDFPDKLDHRQIDVKVTRDTVTGSKKEEKPMSFKFDTVFEPNTTQEQIFERVGPLVESVLDGYKVCVFAYGQTGSGKTHTMEGQPDAPGLIPRAIQQIFDSAETLQQQYSWSFTMTCTYVEIYNDIIRDLLTDNDDYTRAVCEKDEVRHDIRHEGKTDTTITGVRTVTVMMPIQVQEVLAVAAKNRSTAKTKLNERSSRSHSLFTLKVDGVNKMLGTKTSGVLCLIDLAGSERVADSGVQGKQFKEAIAINKSLSHLGDVIVALGKEGGAEANHIPFRNCKLTYMLQNYLGGDACKMLMLVNVSPSEEHTQESISSLRFAQKVNSTVIGPAKKRAQAT